LEERRSRRALLRDAGFVATLKLATSALVLASGFRALSDDDYARIVIAQRFAHAPSLDPSGTSWLPLPFWTTGSAMLVFGRSVATARSVAFVLGVLSVVVVWQAGRWLGLGRTAALFGATLAAVFPYSEWLGVTAVPELPTAALALLGIASLSRTGRARVLGAIALSCACLSRYEAWPLSALFAAVGIWDTVRVRRGRVPLAVASGVSLLGAGLWLANGAIQHGDALFFVQRVSAYRHAIGADPPSLGGVLLRQPLLALRAEPELWMFTLTACIALLLSGRVSELARHARGTLAMFCVMTFLALGDARGGAPTHHVERSLLFVWLWLALVGADAWVSAWRSLHAGARAALIAVTGIAVAPAAGLLRPWYSARDSFIDRSHEVALGQSARAIAKDQGRLLIDTPDFAFYSVIAGFGAPERAEPVDDRDPRKPRVADPWASEESLRRLVAERKADVLVAPLEHAPRASAVGKVVEERGGLFLARTR